MTCGRVSSVTEVSEEYRDVLEQLSVCGTRRTLTVDLGSKITTVQEDAVELTCGVLE